MPSPAVSIVRRLASNRQVPPASGDRFAIIKEMSTAPFDQTTYSAEQWARVGTEIVGEPHPSLPGQRIQPTTMLTSQEAHTAKRARGGEWLSGTTPDEYLADLHAAAGNTEAHLFVGLARVGDASSRHACAATLTSMTAAGLMLQKAVRISARAVFVVYDAAKGCIVTGHTGSEAVTHQLMRDWQNRRVIPSGSSGSGT